MKQLMDDGIDITLPAARTIAAAMREMACVDGLHPNEAEILRTFEEDLPAQELPPEVALETLDAPELREAFFKSLLLVAYADGRLSPEEQGVIDRYTAALSMDPQQVQIWQSDVAGTLLSLFEGVQIYRESVTELGRDLGLSDELIEQALR